MPEDSRTPFADFAAIARVSRHTGLTATRFTSIGAEIANRAAVPASWSTECFSGFRTDTPEVTEDGFLLVCPSFLAVYIEGQDLRGAPSPPDYDPESPPDVLIEVAMELSYTIPKDEPFDESDLAEFARVNGVLHAWPYWREVAQSSSVRLGLTPLVVGNYRVPSPYDALADAPSEDDA